MPARLLGAVGQEEDQPGAFRQPEEAPSGAFRQPEEVPSGASRQMEDARIHQLCSSR